MFNRSILIKLCKHVKRLFFGPLQVSMSLSMKTSNENEKSAVHNCVSVMFLCDQHKQPLSVFQTARLQYMLISCKYIHFGFKCSAALLQELKQSIGSVVLMTRSTCSEAKAQQIKEILLNLNYLVYLVNIILNF